MRRAGVEQLWRIGAEPVGRPLHNPLDLLRVYSIVGAHALRQRQPRVVDVGRDDSRCARRPADSDREDSDRAAAGDEHHRARNLRR